MLSSDVGPSDCAHKISTIFSRIMAASIAATAPLICDLDHSGRNQANGYQRRTCLQLKMLQESGVLGPDGVRATQVSAKSAKECISLRPASLLPMPGKFG